MEFRQESFQITPNELEEGINKLKKRYKHAYFHEGGDFIAIVVFRTAWQGLATVTVIIEPLDDSNYIMNIIYPDSEGWGIQGRFTDKILSKFSNKS